jgi:hypothetical protein
MGAEKFLKYKKLLRLRINEVFDFNGLGKVNFPILGLYSQHFIFFVTYEMLTRNLSVPY